MQYLKKRSLFIQFSLILSLCLLGLHLSAQEKPATKERPVIPLAIKARQLLDVKTGRYLDHPVVIVEGSRITAVGSNLAIPAGAKIIDLGSATLLPGLIDLHVHIGGGGQNVGTARGALKAAKNAEVILKTGFTTLRSMGGYAFTGVALRDAINDGDVVGPRIFDAGTLLTTTGGHCSGQTGTPENSYESSGVANGADAFEKKVREQFKFGADFIKICITGGFMSGTDPRVTQFSEEELKSVIETAHRYGKKVAVHAHGKDGILLAARLGADSIEHASLIDDEGISAVKKNNVALVPTLDIDAGSLKYSIARGANPATIAVLKKTSEAHKANISKAIKAGVTILFGSDQPTSIAPEGTNAIEFAYLVDAGLTPLQAIQSATVSAARWLNAEADIGTIEVGKYADLIAVNADPLKDIRVLEQVRWVLKGGVVYKSE